MSDPTNPLDWAEYAENDWEAAKLQKPFEYSRVSSWE